MTAEEKLKAVTWFLIGVLLGIIGGVFLYAYLTDTLFV